MAILLETRSDSSQAQADLAKLKGSVESIQGSVEKTAEKFKNLANTIAIGFATFTAGTAFTRLQDDLTNFRTKLQLATDSQEQFNTALRDVRKIAIETKTELSSVATLYKKVSVSGKEIGASQASIGRFTKLVSQAIAISGAGVQEANAAILQLGQGLGSGKLAGDELKSILENAPSLAEAIAKGLGKSVGELRKMGEAGELTSVKVFKALLSQQSQVEANFKKINITFGSAFLNLKTSLIILFDEVKTTFLGSSNVIANFINKTAVAIFNFADNFKINLMLAKLYIREFVIDAIILFNDLLRFFNIDLNKFFINLKPATDTIKNWATTAEKWFAWLYDKVVGNSWVPDLIEGVKKWVEELRKKPLTTIKEFASKANESFSKIVFNNSKVNAPIAVGLGLLLKYRNSLLGVLAAVTAVGAAFGTLLFAERKGLISLGLQEKIDTTKDLFSKEKLTPNIKATSQQLEKDVFNFFNKNPIGVKVKGLFSREKLTPQQMEGKLKPGVPQTEEELKKAKENTLLKQVFRVFPESVRVPLVATLGGAFTLALTSAFNNPVLKTAAFATGTTLGAAFAIKAVDKDVIVKETGKGAFGFLDIIERGISKIFDGNVIKDPLGLLAVAAKIALLFSAGRAAIGQGILAGLGAPTNLGQNIIQKQQERLLRADVARTNESIRTSGLEGVIREQQRILRGLTNQLGQQIGAVNAARSIAAGQWVGVPAGTQQQNQILQQALAQSANLRASQSALQQMTSVRDETLRRANTISENIRAQGDAFRQGIVNTGAALGAGIGGVAGFQVGVEIARGMTDAPGWKKVGVVIGTSILAQTIGSAIGTAITAAIVSGIPMLVTMFTGPIIARLSTLFVSMIPSMLLRSFLSGAAIVGIALYAGYKLFTNLPETWKSKLYDFNLFGAKDTDKARGIQTEAEARAKGQQIQTPAEFSQQIKDTFKDKTIFTILFEGIVNSVKDGFREAFKAQPKQPVLTTTDIDPKTLLSIQNKASGGWITGPGTATSDSIPAMLSNGEFVVNARDARKNWNLLTAINSGRDVQYFSKGTETIDGLLNGSFGKIGEQKPRKGIPVLRKIFKKPAENIKELEDRKRVDAALNKYKNDLLGSISSTFNIPKLPDVRGLSAVFTYEALKNKTLDYKTLLKSYLGIPPDFYEQLSEENKKRLTLGLEDAGESGIAAKIKQALGSGIISKTIGIATLLGTGNPILAKSAATLSTILLTLDQLAIPVTLGAFRGYRHYNNGRIFENELLDTGLKNLEEIQIGGSAIFSKAVAREISSLASPEYDFENLENITKLQEYFNYRKEMGLPNIPIEQLDPKTLLPLLGPQTSKFPLKKATGGWIRGPGSGISDSIPAMLSNGEFVVNAKSAKENWPLLTAINSGQVYKGFEGGTATKPIAKKTEEAKDQSLDAFDNFIRDLFKSLGGFFEKSKAYLERILPEVDKSFGKMFGLGKQEAPVLSFSDIIEKQSPAEAAKTIAAELSKNKFGFKDISVERLTQLAVSKEPSDSIKFKNLIESLERVVNAQKAAERIPKGQIGRGFVETQVTEAGRTLAAVLQSLDVAKEVPERFKEKPPEPKLTELTVGDQFKVVNEALPQLRVTQELFESFPDDFRKAIFEGARALKSQRKALEDIPSGTLEKGGAPEKAFELEAKFRKLGEDTNLFIARVRDEVNAYFTEYTQLKPSFEKIGVSIEEITFSLLEDNIKDKIKAFTTEASDALDTIRKTGTTREVKRDAAKKYRELIKNINEALQPPVGDIEKLKTELTKAGVSIDELTLARVGEFDRNTLKGYLTALSDPNLGGGSEEAAIMAKKAIVDKINAFISNSIPRKLDRLEETTKLAGEGLASSVSEGLSTGISDLLKGKRVSLMGVAKDFINNVTSSIVDTFVKGLMDPITGEGGMISNFAKDLGKSIFGQGFGIFGKDPIKDANKKYSDSQNAIIAEQYGVEQQQPLGILDSLTSKLKGGIGDITDKFTGLFKDFKMPDLSKIFEGFTSMFKNFDFGSIFKFFGFADGGKVSGPGTGTSDSIPAMLSNGEFVVNANATKENIKLLAAINSGRFRKFAEGGLVSTALIAAPAIADVKTSESNSKQMQQQVINLSITGDISRQTKAEIYQMLPSIAEGVNAHNREKGYR